MNHSASNFQFLDISGLAFLWYESAPAQDKSSLSVLSDVAHLRKVEALHLRGSFRRAPFYPSDFKLITPIKVWNGVSSHIWGSFVSFEVDDGVKHWRGQRVYKRFHLKESCLLRTPIKAGVLMKPVWHVVFASSPPSSSSLRCWSRASPLVHFAIFFKLLLIEPHRYPPLHLSASPLRSRPLQYGNRFCTGSLHPSFLLLPSQYVAPLLPP